MGRKDTEHRAGVPADLQARLDRRILEMIHQAGAGHPGGSLSVSGLLAEIMIQQGRFRPGAHDGDWLVLAKGHAAPALYAVLAELVWIEEAELASFKHHHSRLQGHPDRRKAPGVQVTTGHLGQGLSIGLGLALAERYKGSDRYTWVVLGEGDLHEGQTWEAIMAASHHRVANLTAVVDANGLSQHGPVSEIMGLEPLAERFAAFGWSVLEVDGHNPAAVAEAIADARTGQEGPVAVIARTVKGHGISFMVGDPLWHSRALSADELADALSELPMYDVKKEGE